MLASTLACLLPLALLPPTTAAQTQSAASGGCVPDPAEVDFGDVFEGEVLKRMVTFTNNSEAEWALRGVNPSCGCTVARIFGPDGSEIPSKSRPDKPLVTLAPHESIQVEVEFLTAGQNGTVEKRVEVHPVDPAEPTVIVPVRARVSKALVVSPNLVNLSNIGKHDQVEQILTIQAQEIGPWTIEGFESAVPAQPLPEFVHFEVLDDQGSSRRIKLSLDNGRSVGTLSLRVRALIAHPRVKFIDFYVSGVIMPDVIFDSGHPTFPQSISFDQVEPGKEATRVLHIINKDPSVPYVLGTIDLLTGRPENFTSTIRTIEEGIEYEVELTAHGDILPGFFRGTLQLHAEHPDVSLKTVPFHGWVKQS